ncbi:hypothetical protein OC25_07940 [Pedobacter kyungheensis]|uniref:RHS repeat-associated core domain-containing protein n=1 Tax=Pedobacter kyungheensis TaxID=1069985 RepID=A0A0C1FTV7_9SPHI|nr:RHS repeat-associated core domain-containing protein [Pedobacter kyungheensis]KIA95233.1 hypothetical protein OC25_07940 [Pedobacter kyungheensis]
MGNIASLTRDGFGTNSYTGYNGNKLTNISGFTNSTYDYDANGNLTNDSQKNISLVYNLLNLPQTVSGSRNLTYTYNAAGEKLQKQAGGTTTNYIDGIQYTNNSIDFIQTEEGLARRSGNNYSYEYNLSDHLGNVRVTFYQNPNTNQLEVLQRDDYYAFGLRKAGLVGANNNKYLYNGKELQEELGQYDYGARFYDPVIGRWNVVDPSSEQGGQESLTQYQYGMNNPVRYTDPDGRCPTCPMLWAMQLYESAKYKVKSVFGLKTYADGMMEKAQNQYHSQDPDYVKNVPEKDRRVINKVKNIKANTKIIQGYGEMMGNASEAMGLAMTGAQSTFSLTASAENTVINRLSNAEVREWYNIETKSINTAIAPTEKNAMLTNIQRNSLKYQARYMMADREAATALDVSDPIKPLEFYVKKYTEQGYSGENLWQKIIQGSSKPNPTVNAKFGIK